MSIEVTIPALGESIIGGMISAWHVADGDYVDAEQPLYELETDKITSEGTAAAAGRISISAPEGDEVEVGQVIALIDDAADRPDNTAAEARAAAMVESEPSELEPTSASPFEVAVTPEKEPEEAAPAQSPAVRRISAESGIDPAQVEGTGKSGRPTKADLLEMIRTDSSGIAGESAAKVAPGKTTPPVRIAAQDVGERPSTRKKMSPLRRRIAERLVEAQRTAAILTTFNEADMTAVIELRKKHQESFTARHGIKLGFMSFFVKASVYALREVPAINARIDGTDVVENHYFDIGVAVSTDKGLMVPVIRDCDQISFAEIESRIAEYAGKAREGKITVDDLQGGVFTITNGGIFGSLLSTPILNQPQSGILGMHTIQQRPIVSEGQIVARPMMYLALSYDHRIVDGREAVTFLIRLKERIEDPARLLLGA